MIEVRVLTYIAYNLARMEIYLTQTHLSRLKLYFHRRFDTFYRFHHLLSLWLNDNKNSFVLFFPFYQYLD
jgi:hypothetical protein